MLSFIFYIYAALFYLLIPFIIVYLIYRGHKNPDYLKYWSERFGIKFIRHNTRPVIWLHAVSVGETRAMLKLVANLAAKYPEYQIITTHMTPTGRDMAAKLYKNVHSYYVPYDMPHAVRKFYDTFKPCLGLIMETEVWPNLISYARQYHVPLFLVNARLSDRSYNAYAKIRHIITPILNKLTGIMAQDKLTADNFKRLGVATDITITGSTKFDLLLDDAARMTAKFLGQNIPNKKVVVFASTRDSEEALILAALPKMLDYLVIIVPRHLERFNLVEELIKTAGFRHQKRSDNLPINPDIQILLGDSLGEMMAYYELCDIAVIGGSFADFGSHNPIEPLFLQKPIILGSSTYNFSQISTDAINAHCAVQVASMDACITEIERLLNDNVSYNQLKQNCANFINDYHGASDKVVEAVAKYTLCL